MTAPVPRVIVPGEEELGEQKLCPSCGDFWPIERDFFWIKRDGRAYSWCRACTSERKQTTPSALRRRRVA